MDDPAQIPTLVNVAESMDLTGTFAWIKKNLYQK